MERGNGGRHPSTGPGSERKRTAPGEGKYCEERPEQAAIEATTTPRSRVGPAATFPRAGVAAHVTIAPMRGSRSVYVISDLHVGGRYGAGGDDRGFRMCTRVDELRRFVEHIVAEVRSPDVGLELVINGDFIDFLAEPDLPPHGGGAAPTTWSPTVHSPGEAVRKLRDIVLRDQPFFDALGALLAAGHALTVLLGNHDVELSYPAVHAALRGHLGADEHSAFTFLLDDQAYVVGDALIEHGNRYDGFNRIDHDALRQARAMQSRGEPTDDGPYHAPPGSRLVAHVMDPSKARYPFVDLLKPETEAVLPILAALVPGVRWKLPYLLWLTAEASLRRDIAAREGQSDQEPHGADTAASDDDDAPARPRHARKKTARQRDEEQLLALLAGPMTEAGAVEFLRKLAAADAADPPPIDSHEAADAPRGQDIAGVSGHVLRLLGSVDPRGLKARLPALLDALRAARNNQSFNVAVETEKAYLDAAQNLAATGRRYVVFGHTHLAKRIELPGGATYPGATRVRPDRHGRSGVRQEGHRDQGHCRRGVLRSRRRLGPSPARSRRRHPPCPARDAGPR